jgi:DNA-binding NarL/FixJ family response regulator
MNAVLLAVRDACQAGRWRAELSASARWTVLPLAHSNAEARLLLARERPELLITEPRLLDGDTVALIRVLQQRARERAVATLVLTAGDEDPLLMDALQAGADSLLDLRQAGPGALAEAARDTLAGGAQIVPWIARRLLEYFGGSGAERVPSVEDLVNPLALTGSERTLLRRLALGRPLGELARDEGVPARVLTARVRTVYRKMQWGLRAGDLKLA